MVDTAAFIRASLGVGREFFTPPRAQGDIAHSVPHLVPIRSLGPAHRTRIAAHLLGLPEGDRYLRFGYPATDEQIQRYADSLNFERDEIFGIYNRRLQLVAVAHLALVGHEDCGNCAEFGVSVDSHSRGRGYGTHLFERAAIHARNAGVEMLFIHALSENTAMLSIASKAGALIERSGSETQAHLLLPPSDMDSRMTEFIEEKIAQTDYRLKAQAKQFWAYLASLQPMR